ncbi:MAG: pyridoxine 5'-phosphate synthase [Candidatus Omnitrophota bacterium]|nr:pyridoxine 5'-phosphate synthase [Candidatus Omnitrophota bacterium]
MRLGVNIDHVATVREARKTFEPDPVSAAGESERAGCDSIVCHLRKDRRHINDNDLALLKSAVKTRLNLEMSVDPEIIDIACSVKPAQGTIVPEKRMEITTEGGLDVVSHFHKVAEAVKRLSAEGIEVSLFIDPDADQVEAAKASGAGIIEFHTGRYAEAFSAAGKFGKEKVVLEDMTVLAMSKGLFVSAGHGLTYQNVLPIAQIEGIEELNIGHSIISRAVFTGIYAAVKEMMGIIK